MQRYFRSELRTVSQPTLNVKQIGETPIALPPHPVRQAFVNSVTLRTDDDIVDWLKAHVHPRKVADVPAPGTVEFWVDGLPATYATGEREHRWKAAVDARPASVAQSRGLDMPWKLTS